MIIQKDLNTQELKMRCKALNTCWLMTKCRL